MINDFNMYKKQGAEAPYNWIDSQIVLLRNSKDKQP